MGSGLSEEGKAVGYPVNLAMKQTHLFPHMVIQMTAIGEEAGALDTTRCRKTHHQHEALP